MVFLILSIVSIFCQHILYTCYTRRKVNLFSEIFRFPQVEGFVFPEKCRDYRKSHQESNLVEYAANAAVTFFI